MICKTIRTNTEQRPWVGFGLVGEHQQVLEKRGVFDYSFGETIGFFNEKDDKSWVTTDNFMIVFD